MNKITEKNENHEELKGAISNELKALEEKAGAFKSKAIDVSSNQYNKAIQRVKDKPLLAVGIAAGVGAIIGLCLRRK